MGRSNQRQQYFEREIRYQGSVQEYMLALAQSPYKTHRRMAEALLPMYEELIKEKKGLHESNPEII